MLKGVMPALITPMTRAGEVDVAGLHRLLDHVFTADISGLVTSGSTGEGARLTAAQRLTVLTEVSRRCSNRVPILATAYLPSPADTSELDELARAGATTILVPPPTYFPLTDHEVQRYYELVAEKAPIPIVLYNIPVFTKISISPAVVGHLSAHPSVVGIKDSSQNLQYQKSLRTTAGINRDFSILTGNDTTLISSMGAGVNGAIVASANIFPCLAVALYDAIVCKQLRQAVVLQARIVELVELCRSVPFPTGWKLAAAALRICEPTPVPPAICSEDDVTSEVLTKIRQFNVADNLKVYGPQTSPGVAVVG